ncbi:hypothetical protein FMM74_019700 [Lachnospiraceae bacterium MD308]|nr:hypothetical protein [Lachnospiraceae bacterium MD308]
MAAKNTKEFSVDLITRDSMSDNEFNTLMEKGLLQAKEDKSYPVNDVFDSLEQELQ